MKPIYLFPILLIAGCSKHNASTQPYVDTTPQADIESLINAEAERLYAVFRAPKEAKTYWGEKPKTDAKGLANVIREFILKNANDPSDLEFIDNTKIRRAKTGWMQIVKLRAKNGLGAKMVYERGYIVFKDSILLDFEENLFESYNNEALRIEAEDEADWNLALQTATVTVKAKFKKR
jgi:hypothetical protein